MFKRYLQKDWKLSFWRTSHGAEVDLLISRGTKLLYAIECKFTNQPSTSHLSGLRSFHEKHPDVPCYIVAPVNQPYRLSFARVLPPYKLLQEL
jgi:predicted AAA+ superfamily ATPase